MDEYSNMQDKLEKQIIQINKSIIEINIKNEMKTPFISDTILKKKSNGIKKLYSKFIDGVHPGEDLYRQWSNLISQKIDYNFAVPMDAKGSTDDGHAPQQSKRPPEQNHPDENHGKRKC